MADLRRANIRVDTKAKAKVVNPKGMAKVKATRKGAKDKAEEAETNEFPPSHLPQAPLSQVFASFARNRATARWIAKALLP